MVPRLPVFRTTFVACMASMPVRPSRDKQLELLFKARPRIILGTESSSRRAIMDELAGQYGFQYETMKAAIDELAIGNRRSQPGELVKRLARAKADAIIKQSPGSDGYLLTCDQVVVHDGRILEKPRDATEARRFIRGYGQSPASTVGSICCTNLATGDVQEALDVTQISFKPIPEAVVEQLIAQGEVFYCAGGLRIEDPLVEPLITSKLGSDDAIMGLCKETVLNVLLKAHGLEFQEEEVEMWDSEDA